MRTPGARAWRWIFVAALIVIAVGWLGSARLLGGGDGDGAGARSQTPDRTAGLRPTVGPSVRDPSRPPPGDDGGALAYTAGPSAAPDPRALVVVRGFAVAWARPELTDSQWRAGVQRWTDQAYSRRLHSVDPANVPASRVTGAPRVISSTTDLLVATVPTDGGTLTVTCARFGRIWRVTLHDFRRTGA